MRAYVDKHPAYTRNSILSKQVMDDLLITLHRIEKGEVFDENFKRVFKDWKPFNTEACKYQKSNAI